MSKVVFNAEKARKTITVELPGIPGSELVFFCQLTVGQERELAMQFPNYMTNGHADQLGFMTGSVGKRLKSWNLTDENNEDMPIDQVEVVLGALDGGDTAHILTKIKEAAENTAAGLGLAQPPK